MVAIHADAGRENDVIAELEANAVCDVVIKQLKVADFAICDGDVIVAAFERKTWRDLSDSIKSPERRANNDKLVTLQAETGCRVFYLIEGNRPSKQSRGVPVKNMQSYLDARILRDGFHVIYTRNHADTAATLIRLAGFCKDHPVEGGAPDHIVGNSNKLYEKKIKEPHVIYEQMWHNLHGVTAANYSSLNFSMRELFATPPEEMACKIAKLKYSSGRALGRKVAEKITSNIADVGCHVKMLMAIPRVTQQKAELILAQYSILALLQGEFDISNIEINNRRLGAKLNEDLHQILECDTVSLLNEDHSPVESHELPVGSPESV